MTALERVFFKFAESIVPIITFNIQPVPVMQGRYAEPLSIQTVVLPSDMMSVLPEAVIMQLYSWASLFISSIACFKSCSVLSCSVESMPTKLVCALARHFISERFPFITAGFTRLRKFLTKSYRSLLQVIPTISIIMGILYELAVCPESIIDSIRASVIVAMLRQSELADFVMSQTSRGCSAIIGLAPSARTAFAQSFMDIGLVMQCIRGLFLRISART